MRKASPLASILSTARSLAIQGRPLTPAILKALDKLLPLREPLTPGAKEPRTELLPWPRLADDGRTPLGVDLSKRRPIEQLRPGEKPPKCTAWEELRPLIIAGGYRAAGFDLEDIVGEVALVITRRNHMPSAFDPRKSGFAHYVNMIALNACRNLAASRKGGDDLTEDGDVHVSDDEVVDRLVSHREAIEELVENDPAEARELLAAIDSAHRARRKIRREP